MTSIIIGVDGGGSKTRLVAADPSGHVLTSVSGGPSAIGKDNIDASADTIAALVRDDDDRFGWMAQEKVLGGLSAGQAFIVVLHHDGGKGDVRPLGNNGFQRLDDVFGPAERRQHDDDFDVAGIFQFCPEIDGNVLAGRRHGETCASKIDGQYNKSS